MTKSSGQIARRAEKIARKIATEELLLTDKGRAQLTERVPGKFKSLRAQKLRFSARQEEINTRAAIAVVRKVIFAHQCCGSLDNGESEI